MSLSLLWVGLEGCRPKIKTNLSYAKEGVGFDNFLKIFFPKEVVFFFLEEARVEAKGGDDSQFFLLLL